MHTVNAETDLLHWRAHFNSDFSGNVAIQGIDPTTEFIVRLEVPGELIIKLAQRYCENTKAAERR